MGFLEGLFYGIAFTALMTAVLLDGQE